MSHFYKKWMSITSYPFFLCLFFCINTTISYAQDIWEFDKQDINYYNHLLTLKINDQVVANLQNERNSTLYLRHFENSIKLLISDNQEKLSSYEKNTDQILSHFKKQKGDSPYLKFYIAEISLQSAFVHLKLGHEFSAGWELRKAYREIRKNVKDYPDFLPQYKTIGLLHVIIGSVPDKYNWLLSLLGMDGSVTEGLDELNLLANSDNIFKTEAKLLILLMQGYILQETPKSVEGLRQLYYENTHNLLIGYLYLSMLMKNQQNESALKVLDSLDALQSSKYLQFPLLKYLKAAAFLQKGDYSKSIDQYSQFINIHQGKNYLKDAYYKIGLAYWLLNQPDSATRFFQNARDAGETLTEIDKNADKQLENAEFPNRKILEARLLTDGGYYDQALEKLNAIHSNELQSHKDQVELNYRKARIFHQTNQINAAIAFYKLTIHNIEKNDWYFAPNSALQLGFIYQSEDNQYLAEKYFKKALSYKDHEYKNSIDNKAKSALSTLKD